MSNEGKQTRNDPVRVHPERATGICRVRRRNGTVEEERQPGKPVPRPGLHGTPLPEGRSHGTGRKVALRVRQGRKPDRTIHRYGKMAGRKEGTLEIQVER